MPVRLFTGTALNLTKDEVSRIPEFIRGQSSWARDVGACSGMTYSRNRFHWYAFGYTLQWSTQERQCQLKVVEPPPPPRLRYRQNGRPVRSSRPFS